MSRVVQRASKMAVGVEQFTGVDAQSRPAYQASVTIMARIVREDQVVKAPDGTEVRTQYTGWVDASQGPLPLWRDRLTFTTLGESHTAIVEFHKELRDLRGAVDHVKILCREE